MDLHSFPNRSHLGSRHAAHFAVARTAWNERERVREAFQSQVKAVLPALAKTDKRRVIWETGCCVNNELWMTATEDQLTLLYVLRQSDDEVFQIPLSQVIILL